MSFVHSFISSYSPLIDLGYIKDILTDMKKLLITFDDETAKVLEKFPNTSFAVREAVKGYTSDISTDTMARIKQAFTILLKADKERQERDAELYEMVEGMKQTLEEVLSR